MEKLIMAGQLLLGLSILVIIHEFGHFIAARMFGIKVEKFFLFFDVGGFKLFSFKKGDTLYGVGWLPLGGYVKITGMIDESMDKDFANKPAEPHEFRSKPAWQRLIVMLGGIIMNVILGILIFTLHTWHYGENYVPATELKNGIEAKKLGKEVGFETGDIILKVNGKEPERLMDVFNSDIFLDKNASYEVERNGKIVKIELPSDFGSTALNDGLDSFISFRQAFKVDSIAPGSNAAAAGLRKNDSIVSVNGIKTPYLADLKNVLQTQKNNTVDVTVVRKEEGQNNLVTLPVKVGEDGTLGFTSLTAVAHKSYNFATSFTVGVQKAWRSVFDTLRGLWRMITGDLPAKKSLHGFIGIATFYGGAWNWYSFWALTAMLSMILAFMNFLPIPALDGGHVLFLLVEMLRGKPLSVKFLETAQMVGMVLLFLLMGFALYNDFTQFVFK